MSNLETLFLNKNKPKLAIYTVVGYPTLEKTYEVIDELLQQAPDIIELGIPFSDPVADGLVIQNAHDQALKENITLNDVLAVTRYISEKSSVAIVGMGYLNPILSFGFEDFLDQASKAGMSGLIIPDLPPEEYVRNYQSLFQTKKIHPIFLVTPTTTDERVCLIDSLSEGFLYVVSSLAITGTSIVHEGASIERDAYLQRLSRLKLKNPLMVGFGIANRNDFNTVTSHVAGAIIGSAFIKNLDNTKNLKQAVKEFMEQFI